MVLVSVAVATVVTAITYWAARLVRSRRRSGADAAGGWATTTVPFPAAARPRKPYRGLAMEGVIARWYAKTQAGRADYAEVATLLAPRIPLGGSFLEVAPGPGYHTIELAGRCECQAFGLDISETFVHIATANARSAGVAVDFRLGDAAQLPFANESFDLVVCQAALKNFTQPVEALAEMRRVLKPGGGCRRHRSTPRRYQGPDRRDGGRDGSQLDECDLHQAGLPFLAP